MVPVALAGGEVEVVHLPVARAARLSSRAAAWRAAHLGYPHHPRVLVGFDAQPPGVRDRLLVRGLVVGPGLFEHLLVVGAFGSASSLASDSFVVVAEEDGFMAQCRRRHDDEARDGSAEDATRDAGVVVEEDDIAHLLALAVPRRGTTDMGSGASTRVRAPVLGRAVLVKKTATFWRSLHAGIAFGAGTGDGRGGCARGGAAGGRPRRSRALALAPRRRRGLRRSPRRARGGKGGAAAGERRGAPAERWRSREASSPMDPNPMSPASVVAAAFRRGADSDEEEDEDEDAAGAIPVRRISSVALRVRRRRRRRSTRSGRSTASSSTVASSSHATTGARATELHPSHPDLIFTPRRSRVTVARWSGHGGEKTLALGRDTGEVELLRPNRESGGLDLVDTLRGHAASVTDLDWSAGGNELVTSSADGDVRHWSKSVDVSMEVSRNEWRCNRSLLGDSSELVDDVPTSAVRFHPTNSNMVLVGRADRTVTLVNLSTGATAARCGANAYMRSAVSSVCTDSSGGMIYAGDSDGKVLAMACSVRSAGVGGRSRLAPFARAAASSTGAWSLTLVCRLKPPASASGRRGERGTNTAVLALAHETFLTATRGPAVLAAHADGCVRIIRAPGLPKPDLTPAIVVRLPRWPGPSGACVAFAPAVDPSVSPNVSASTAGGADTAGAAVFAAPSKAGAPDEGASLAVKGAGRRRRWGGTRGASAWRWRTTVAG